jgi:GxxExxY protein
LDPDPVIDAYKPGVDMTLVRENLKLTSEQRLRRLMELQRAAEELRRAGRVENGALGSWAALGTHQGRRGGRREGMSRQDAKTPGEDVCTEPGAVVDDLASQVIDAAMEVHRHLGPAFVESVYENALCHELSLRKLAHRRQVVVPVRYKDLLVGEGRADILVGDLLVVELKALPALAPVHLAQVLSYLRAMGLQLALLINFGEHRLKAGCRRVVLTR